MKKIIFLLALAVGIVGYGALLPGCFQTEEVQPKTLLKALSKITISGCEIRRVEGEGEAVEEEEPDKEGEREEGEHAEGEGEEGEGLPDIPEDMIALTPASFLMGRAYTDTGENSEIPVHEVVLSPYYLSKHEVTNGQFAEVLNFALSKGYIEGGNGRVYDGKALYFNKHYLGDSYGGNSFTPIVYEGKQFSVQERQGYGGSLYAMEDHPVVMVSWYGAVAYCNWRSEMEGLQPCYNLRDWSRKSPLPDGYRLPTEAEWECAAAWDGTVQWRYGCSSDSLSPVQANFMLDDYANPLGLYNQPFTAPVGWYDGVHLALAGRSDIKTEAAVSPSGAFDMAGNVSEWCHDWYAYDYYAQSPKKDPGGPQQGADRVFRGGSWANLPANCRAAVRFRGEPEYAEYHLGFRVARSTK
ncbi:MAG: formylglycine-generating enzyme family protein [Candidatus Hydrogenedentales bacterium]|jgi:formylglycine-generating enzyme required for sulfatase activity